MEYSTLLRHFQNALQKHTERLEYLENSMEELLKKKDISKVSAPGFGDYLVLNGALMRERAYIDWINDCIKRIS
jgi:hypothetical protein